MKYKNYRNPYTNDNRIYSYTDLYNMSLGEFIKRKQEVLGQYRVLGVPSEGELKSSPNAVWVEAYTRDDGTEVKAHYRSKPNGGSSQTDAGSSTGGASEVSENKQNEQKNVLSNNKQNSEETITKQERIEKMIYPNEVAGVKRGKPKTFEQMMQQGVNPNYMSEEDKDGDYSQNCQSCTVAAELVIRGYDVEAGPYSTPEAKELGYSSKSAYLDPETGKECVSDIIYTNEIDCYDYLEQNIKQGERYELIYNTPTESGDLEKDIESEYSGHSVLITRCEDGELLYYDPQMYQQFKGESAKKYISSWFQYEHTIVAPPRILRVDDKALNLKYVNKVVKRRQRD